MKKLIVALLAGAAAMSAAQAQTSTGGTTPPRFYIGAGVATSDHKDDFGLSGFSTDGWTASGKIFGGYEIDPTWGVEVGYTDSSSADFHFNSGTNNIGGDTKGYGVYVAAKYNYPINDQFSAFGKLGVQHSNRELNSPILHLNDSDNGAYGALGVQYNINQQVALTAEYERYGKAKAFGAKADVLSFGARYSF